MEVDNTLQVSKVCFHSAILGKTLSNQMCADIYCLFTKQMFFNASAIKNYILCQLISMIDFPTIQILVKQG